jgi:hypothetical protein
VKTVETELVVAENGDAILNLQLPDVAPGEHRVVLMIDDRTITEAVAPILDFIPLAIPWPTDSTFRREDIYGDDGR